MITYGDTDSENFIIRDSLIAELDLILSKKLALVVAPHGYGKTVLLNQWLKKNSNNNIHTVWCKNLDYQDETNSIPGIILRSWEESVASGSIMSDANPGSNWQSKIDNLLTASLSSSDHIVILLDDYQLYADTGLNTFVQYVIDNIPDNVHLIISGTTVPAITFPTLRLQNQLLELYTNDLAFNLPEINTIFSTYNLVQSEKQILLESTEGWPIAVMSLEKEIKAGNGLQDALDYLTGRTKHISQYFYARSFQNMPDSSIQILIKTSVVGRISGELVNLLCDREDGGALLQKFHQQNYFLVSLDNENRWFRYQKYFREFLYKYLEDNHSATLLTLHQKASEWYLANTFFSEALKHALLCKNREIIIHSLEKAGGWRIGITENLKILEDAIAELNQGHLESAPRVWLGKIYLLLKKGAINIARNEYQRLSKTIGEQCSNSDSSLKEEMALLDCAISLYSDEPVGNEKVVRMEAMAGSLLNEDNFLQAGRWNTLGNCYLEQGEFEKALQAGNESLVFSRRIGSHYAENFCYFQIGNACMELGRLFDADAFFRLGYSFARKHYGRGSDMAAIGSVYVAELAYERNAINTSVRHSGEALPHVEDYDAWGDVLLTAYITSASLARYHGEYEAELQILRRGIVKVESRNLFRVRTLLHSHLLCSLLRLGKVDEAQQICDKESLWSFYDESQFYNNEYALLYSKVSLALVRLTLAQKNYDAALKILESLHSRAKSKQHARQLMEINLLLSALLYSQGKKEESLDSLGNVLTVAAINKFKRMFIDNSHLIRPLVENYWENSKERPASFTKRYLLDLYSEMTKELDREHLESPFEALSEREQQILSFLSHGYSNKEIADQIVVSENTIKYHLKNIYGKLGVNTRQSAIEAGFKMALLP